MKKPEVYLDASVVSAYFNHRMPERMALTRRFWKESLLPRFNAVISARTNEEIAATTDEGLRNKMQALVKDFHQIPVTREIITLAKRYVGAGIFPEKYFDDAIHVAAASSAGIPFLASWNFTHLVKVKH